jgi:hypothetical protein
VSSIPLPSRGLHAGRRVDVLLKERALTASSGCKRDHTPSETREIEGTGRSALKSALALANRCGAALRLVHVVEPLDAYQRISHPLTAPYTLETTRVHMRSYRKDSNPEKENEPGRKALRHVWQTAPTVRAYHDAVSPPAPRS